MGRGGAAGLEAVAASYPNDLTTLPGGQSAPMEGTKNKRKQTLRSLLDALQELSRDEDLDVSAAAQQPGFEADLAVSFADEHLQKVGAETFNKFEGRIVSLDTELREFARAVRHLEGSGKILSSSFHLRHRLSQILHLFRENAADLFPRKVRRRDPDNLMDSLIHSMIKSEIPKQTFQSARMYDCDAEDFPSVLQELSEDLIAFVGSLNTFSEFVDEALTAAIISLESDLKYQASCMKEYGGQFKDPSVQQYLHERAKELGEHLYNISLHVSRFIEIELPTIRSSRKAAAANLLNLPTVATFFSAITATTLQFSVSETDRILANSVNGFWFTSLVLSIGAVVNCLFQLRWNQVASRASGHRVPWWVLVWIKRSPFAFLILSVVCFLMGLVLFAYSSGQHMVTSVVTTVLTALTSFGLVAVLFWLELEARLAISLRTSEGCRTFLRINARWSYHVLYWCRRRWHDVRDQCSHAVSAVKDGFGRRMLPDLETARSENCERNRPATSSFSPEQLSRFRNGEMILNPITEGVPSESSVDDVGDGQVLSDSGSTMFISGSGSDGPNPDRPRLKELVRSIIMINRHTKTGSEFSPVGRRREKTTCLDGGKSERLKDIPAIIKKTRLDVLIPKLKRMEATQEYAPHHALVRHLQFSPDGRFFATSSWDRTSVIFRVGDPCSVHRVLAHPQGPVGQVAWSPHGIVLLTKLNRGMKVWTADGVCKKTIDRRHAVQSITWLPGGEAFLSVEGSYVVKLNTVGEDLERYHLVRMILHDVAVTNDCQRMLCAGTLTASSDGLQPKKYRAEKQILVYNMDKHEIENRVPVLHDVRDITLAKDGHVALVSYEDKAPSQLWKLETCNEAVQLSLRHTYMPKVPVDFAGPSYFGGKNDQLVLCAGKCGDIFIWDRESAALLHHIRPQALGGGDLTCIAWNHASDHFMFATGSHDGGVRIWSNQPSEGIAIEETPS